MNEAIHMLLQGKTDIEILEALTIAMTVNEEEVLDYLTTEQYAPDKPEQKANVAVVETIVRHISNRMKPASTDEVLAE